MRPTNPTQHDIRLSQPANPSSGRFAPGRTARWVIVAAAVTAIAIGIASPALASPSKVGTADPVPTTVKVEPDHPGPIWAHIDTDEPVPIWAAPTEPS